MSEHEVHEIQLNGKQLVFMFMAATVVSVVIFLCGVMVGRGVRQPQADALTATTPASLDSTAPVEETSFFAALPPEPPPEQENLTYGERLQSPTPVGESLKPAPAQTPAAPPQAPAQKPAPTPKPAVTQAVAEPKPAPAPKQSATPAVTEPKPAPAQKPTVAPAVAEKKPAPQPERAANTSLAEPAGNGFVVQVRAYPKKTDADALASRLNGKGYPTFVTVSKGVYRVRVGKYTNKRDAEAIEQRLKREERFDTWLTR